MSQIPPAIDYIMSLLTECRNPHAQRYLRRVGIKDQKSQQELQEWQRYGHNGLPRLVIIKGFSLEGKQKTKEEKPAWVKDVSVNGGIVFSREF